MIPILVEYRDPDTGAYRRGVWIDNAIHTDPWGKQRSMSIVCDFSTQRVSICPILDLKAIGMLDAEDMVRNAEAVTYPRKRIVNVRTPRDDLP